MIYIKLMTAWQKNAKVNKEEQYEKMYIMNQLSNNENFGLSMEKRIDWFKPYTKIKNVKLQ